MQGFGKLQLNTCSVYVLVRKGKYGVYIRLAKGKTKEQVNLADESEFLKDRPDLVEKLLKGETIYL